MNTLTHNSKNQHYISQVEQKLNSINPHDRKELRKIYSFTICDKENNNVSLDNIDGTLIESNLSDDFLFSFDGFEEIHKASIEGLFGKYENDYEKIVVSTLGIIENKKDEVEISNFKDIFSLKLLNLFRNPYCIKKTIDTFKYLALELPIHEEFSGVYKQIEDGNNPYVEKISSNYGVSIEEYKQWLKILFNLLTRNDKDTLLDAITNNLFYKNENYQTIRVYPYSDVNVCPVISDRGGIIEENDETIIFSFNLSHTAFIEYTFTDISSFLKSEDDLSKGQKEKLIQSYNILPKEIDLRVMEENDHESLKRYNERAVYYSHTRVFSKTSTIYDL